MAKNNKLINSLKEIAKRNRADNINTASENLIPHVYAAVALALHRECGWGYKRINRLFYQSQCIWESLGEETMVELCEKETGILLQTQKQYDESREDL